MAGENAFRSPKDRGRFLISTPSRLVGDLQCPELSIDHAFPNPYPFNAAQWQSQISGGPYSRSYYVISTAVSGNETDGGGLVPQYDPLLITALASVWFGKRFDLHGWTEWFGNFWMPYGMELSATRMSQLGPYNYEPRRDLGIALNWQQLSRPMTLFSCSSPIATMGAFWKAASFYARALRAYEDDGEVAFLHLICAIEIAASALEFPDERLFDKATLKDLKAIQEHVPDGANVCGRIKSRLYQLRKRVVLAAAELTNDPFFAGSESADDAFALTKGRLTGAVQAAYDVRSRFLHKGATFSLWVDPSGRMLNEMQLGKPVVDDRELAKLLSQIPTFLGLERLVRFMILRLAHSKITPLHEGLGQ